MLGMLWMGCTKQESTVKPEETTAPNSFIRVSIVGQGTSGTRAADNEYKQGSGTYKDGTEVESYVDNVLFLFFDESGKIANVIKTGDTYVNYFLWSKEENKMPDATTGNGDHSETVEKRLEKIITLTIPRTNDQAGKFPKQILTIVNPDQNDLSQYQGKSLTELTEIYDDYESRIKYKPDDDKGKFLMTTSVYIDNAEKKLVNTTLLTEKNFAKDIKGTEASDYEEVVIHVERVLARIDLKIGLEPVSSSETNASFPIYKTGKYVSTRNNDNNSIQDEEVYVRLLGWNVFDTPDKSYLIKNINDENWISQENSVTSSKLFGTNTSIEGPWNSPEYHRSFWAINPPEKTNSDKGITYKSGKFTNGGDVDDKDFDNDNVKWLADHRDIPTTGESATAYFQENAAPYTNHDNKTTTPSKVILAAQLVDKNGKPRELAKWAGQYWYTWEGLKIFLCNEKLLHLWYLDEEVKDENTGNTTKRIFKQITANDLHYEVSNDDSYTVTVTLATNKKDFGTQRTGGWYYGTNEKDIKKITNEQGEVDFNKVNGYIKQDVGENSVMVWQNGYAYYYFTIRHLGAENSPAEFGIVRNHIYEANVRSLSGLGTPVADTQRTITVTPPTDDTSVLSAEIKILSWRLVQKNYDLTW